jgi:transmembrane sensor
MAEIVRFPDPARSHEDAALWLARLDKGLGADERAALAAWLAESTVNREVLLELASLWDGLDVLAELSDLFPLEHRERVPPRRRDARWLFVGAAALAAVALGGWVVYDARFAPVDAPPVAVARSDTFTTAIGGHATQELADGSTLALNTDTQLDVELATQSRDVFLRRGEAQFAVAHDAARPFRVHVGKRVLEAVGTAFNVHLKPAGSVELTVTDGTVRVAGATPVSQPGAAGSSASTGQPQGAAEDATVTEGELAILDAAASDRPQIVRLDAAGLDIKLAWQRGMLVFQGEPLQQMLDEVSRYTTTEFVLEGDELRGMKVGGYFRAGDIDGLLLALRDNFKIEFERVGADRVVLRTARPAR